MNYQAKLHIKETHTSPTYGRIFEGWMSGDAMNVFAALAHTQCAMSSQQAITYRLAVEERALEFNSTAKIDADGNLSNSTVTVEYLPEFLKS